MLRNLYTFGCGLLLMLGVGMQSGRCVALPHKADSIQIVIDQRNPILPGESFPIGVVSYKRNGKVKKTIGLADGNMWWLRYKVEVSGGSFSGGNVWVNEKLMPSKGKYIELKVAPKKQPELVKRLLLPLNYETKIEFRPTADFDRAPGSQVKGELYTEFDNGVGRICTNLKNSEEAERFNFIPGGGIWKNGKFLIEQDFTKIENHHASLIIESLRNPELTDTFKVLLDYRHTYNLTLAGSGGIPGFSGTDGMNGSVGYHGGDGQPGQHGGFGEDGPDIDVFADLYRDSILNCDLLYVYAQNQWSGEEYRYLINPAGGKLLVNSMGGSGGTGGRGGNGGRGGDGRDGEKWTETRMEKHVEKKPVVKKTTHKEKQKKTDADGKEYEVEVDVEVSETVYVDEETWIPVTVEKQGPGENGGDGGWGGPGGLGGDGGYGGIINLYFTPDAMPYQDMIVARSEGGSGGMHGSGGSGGMGGQGGYGSPNGSSGRSGQMGSSAIGWADKGRDGQIIVRWTEEFLQYKTAQK
ncbi:MAG TPA: hypothetical protein PKO30_07155 [Prolixibacteraceae bacterium]|nr:hypothetical protein [Prolixibacteraceae bacterium]